MSEIVNLTPHEVSVVRKSGDSWEVIATYPASAAPARCEERRSLFSHVWPGGQIVDVNRTEFGPVSNLPDVAYNRMCAGCGNPADEYILMYGDETHCTFCGLNLDALSVHVAIYYIISRAAFVGAVRSGRTTADLLVPDEVVLDPVTRKPLGCRSFCKPE